MKHIAIIYFMIVCSLIACSRNDKESKEKALVNTQNQLAKPITIYIQPFSDVPENYTKYISAEIKKVYSKVEINKPILLPIAALNITKSRYRADSLLRFLNSQTSNGNLTIGITTKDISSTKNNIPDWGIMGLGYCPGKACVASTYRLKGENKLEKLYKVAIHELGHTQGIPHCPNKNCIMQDAEGKDRLNDEKGFCSNCKQKLIKAGWALK
jgi:archaemetzincin